MSKSGPYRGGNLNLLNWFTTSSSDTQTNQVDSTGNDQTNQVDLTAIPFPGPSNDPVLQQNFARSTPFGENLVLRTLISGSPFGGILYQWGTPNTSSFCHVSPLHVACMTQTNIQFIDMILNGREGIEGCNPWLRTPDGNLALHYAANAGSIEVFDFIYSAMATKMDSEDYWFKTPNSFNQNVAHAVCMGGSRLLDVPEGRQRVVDFIQQIGIDFTTTPDAFGYTPFDYANHFYPYLKINNPTNKVPKEIDPNVCDFNGNNPFTYAVLKNDQALAEKLFQNGTPIINTRVQQTPFHLLCCASDNDLFQDSLSRFSYAMNAPDFNGAYPVHYAANFARPALFDRFSNLKPGLDATDIRGRTVGHYVVMPAPTTPIIYSQEEVDNRIKIIETLKKAKPEIFVKPDGFGYTPLYYAMFTFGQLVDVIKQAQDEHLAQNKVDPEIVAQVKKERALRPDIANKNLGLKLLLSPLGNLEAKEEDPLSASSSAFTPALDEKVVEGMSWLSLKGDKVAIEGDKKLVTRLQVN